MRRIAVDSLVALGLFALLLQIFGSLRAELAIRSGDRFAATRQFDLAAVQFQQAVRLTPDRFEPLRALADASVKSYDPAGENLRPLFVAEWALHRAVQVNPLYPYGWAELGEVGLRLNQAGAPDRRNPEPHFRRALEIDPRNPRFLSGFMRWQLAEGRRVEAWDTFLKLIDSDPTTIQAYGNRMVRTDEEVNRLAIEVRDNPRQLVQLARLVYVRGNHARAEQLLRELPEEEQLRPEAAALLGSALRQVGRIDEGEKVMRDSLRRYPDDVNLVRDLGYLLVYAKKGPAAVELFQAELAKNPPEKWMWLEGANIALRAGDWPRAAEWYEVALSYGKILGDGLTRQALLGLIEARRKGGSPRAALIASRQLLDLDPENRKYRELVEQLQLELEKQQPPGTGGEEKP